MPTLVPDVGAATSNSYPSLDEAAQYADSRAGADALAFLALTIDDRARRLITATRAVDAIAYTGVVGYGAGFLGTRASATQALEWPRTGTAYDATVIPLRLKQAVIELALGGDALTTMASVLRNDIAEDTVGPITTKYFDRAKTMPSPLERFPAIVWGMLSPLIRQTVPGWGTTAVAVRGS